MNTWICQQISRVVRTVERIVGEVKDTIEDGRETWRRMRALLDRALLPHPEARAAVVRAFEEELERFG
jgi:hypothetical protein